MKKNIIWIFLMVMILTSCGMLESQSQPLDSDKNSLGEEQIPELIEAAPIEINLAVSSGGMSLFTVRQFYEQKSYHDTLKFNYSVYYSLEGLERDLYDNKMDMGLMPLDFLLQTGTALSDYKILGLVSSVFPQFVSSEKGVTLEKLKRENIDVFYEHELFFRKFLLDNDIDPSRDVNLVVWTDEEKMIAAYKNGEIKQALFSMAQSQKLISEGIFINPILDLSSYIINKMSFNSGVPTGVFVVRNEILEFYPELVKAFENDLLYNNEWLARNYDAAKVYAQQLDLIEDEFDYLKYMSAADYYYEPMQTSKYKFKKYYKWVDNILTKTIKLENTLYQLE